MSNGQNAIRIFFLKGAKALSSTYILVTIQFLKDSEYDPCCCDYAQRVSAHFSKPPGTLLLVEKDDGYTRRDNIADPGHTEGKIDCSLPLFKTDDTPSFPFVIGQEVDFTFTAKQIVSAPGGRRGTCDCENQGHVATISHAVHGTGTFPNLEYSDTLPASLFTGSFRLGAASK